VIYISKVALPWFWEHFDPEKYSIWFGTYKEEYLHYFDAQDFINMNLIGGTFILS